jgi:hypothetical protein
VHGLPGWNFQGGRVHSQLRRQGKVNIKEKQKLGARYLKSPLWDRFAQRKVIKNWDKVLTFCIYSISLVGLLLGVIEEDLK